MKTRVQDLGFRIPLYRSGIFIRQLLLYNLLAPGSVVFLVIQALHLKILKSVFFTPFSVAIYCNELSSKPGMGKKETCEEGQSRKCILNASEELRISPVPRNRLLQNCNLYSRLIPLPTLFSLAAHMLLGRDHE